MKLVVVVSIFLIGYVAASSDECYGQFEQLADKIAVKVAEDAHDIKDILDFEVHNVNTSDVYFEMIKFSGNYIKGLRNYIQLTPIKCGNNFISGYLSTGRNWGDTGDEVAMDIRATISWISKGGSIKSKPIQMTLKSMFDRPIKFKVSFNVKDNKLENVEVIPQFRPYEWLWIFLPHCKNEELKFCSPILDLTIEKAKEQFQVNLANSFKKILSNVDFK